MTTVYHGEDVAFDLYPKTDPKNGPRIRRLTSLQKGTFARREQKGTGVGMIVIPGDSDDAEAIDPTLGHYIKVERKGAIVNLVTSAAADDIVDTAAAHGLVVGDKLEFVSLTGGTGLSTTPAYYVQSVPSSTSLKVATTKGGGAVNFTTDITAGSIRKLKTLTGFFLLGGNYNALSADGTKPLVLTGPGPLHYLARARMAPHSYLGDDPQPEGVWPLHKQGAWFGDDHYGSMFARALTEMKATQADDPGDDPDSPHPNDNDRLDDPLPALTFDFDGFTDSLGNAWTGARGEFDVQVALEDGLRIAFRFMQAGVEIDIDPDQFELHAYNAGTLGTDRTGLAWGAGVVRFQVPTDNTVETGNVFTTARRALAAFIQRSLVWAGREDVWGVARNASAPVRWEGGYSSGAGDEAANNTIAGQQVTERTDAGDVPRLKVWAGNDESRGQYTYGPGGHADIWDRGTVHSGTGTWDWNQWTAPLSALEWRIENANGEFDTYVEFGSTFRSIDEVMRFAGGAVGAHTHPPNPRLCEPHRYQWMLTQFQGPLPQFDVTRVEHGYVDANNGMLVVVWDSDTDSAPASLSVTAAVDRWFVRINGSAVLYATDGARCAITAVDSSTIQQAWEWTDGFGTSSGDFDDSLVEITRAGDGHPELIDGGGRAKRCGDTEHLFRDRAPTEHDDASTGMRKGTHWINIETGAHWVLQDTTVGAAVWIPLGGSASDGPPHAHPDDTNEPFEITTADGWIWFGGPRAVRHGDYTFFGGVNGANGDVRAHVVHNDDPSTVLNTFILHAGLDVDDHCQPALLVREGRLWAFYQGHDPQDGQARLRISTNTLAADPTLTGGFDAQINLDGQIGATSYNYPHPIQLSDGTLHVYYRDGNATTGDWIRTILPSGGDPTADFGAHVSIYTDATGYMKIHESGDRIDFAVSNDSPNVGTTSVGHFYWEAGSFFQTDGTAMGALPYDFSEVTPVHTGTNSWIEDVTRGFDGHPRIIVVTYPTEFTDHRYNEATWTGSEWSEDEICEAGTGIDIATLVYSGGACYDGNDPSVIWASRQVDGEFEIFRYHRDASGTYVGIQVTFESTAKNVRPFSPKGHAASSRVFFMHGTYTGYETFSTGIWAAGIAIGGGAEALDDLDDVAITSAAAGDVLRHDGSEFVNVPAANVGRYEVLIAAESDPAEPLENGDGDWLYVWVPD